MDVAVSQTFAYLNQQMDFPEYRQIRAHFTSDNDYTLCGWVMRGWESVGENSPDGKSATANWLCKSCQRLRG